MIEETEFDDFLLDNDLEIVLPDKQSDMNDLEII